MVKEMIELISKNGKTEAYTNLAENFYISKKTFEQYHTEEHFRSNVYFAFNGVAILCGYISKKQLMDNLKHYVSIIEESIQNYINNFIESISLKSFKASHEVYTSDFKYVQTLLLGQVEEHHFENFKVKYQEYLDNKEKEREAERVLKEAQDKEREILRLESIGDKIKNDEKISGREMLDYINYKKVEVPLRTKGLINRCGDINSKGLIIIKGKKPNSANNVFIWYRNLKEI